MHCNHLLENSHKFCVYSNQIFYRNRKNGFYLYMYVKIEKNMHMRYDVTDSNLLIQIKNFNFQNLSIIDHNHDSLKMYLHFVLNCRKSKSVCRCYFFSPLILKRWDGLTLILGKEIQSLSSALVFSSILKESNSERFKFV